MRRYGIILAVESQEEIVVIRSARKTISLTVNENGAIVVKAPKFVKDAEKFAEEDKKHKEVIEAKNQGDSVLYQTEKALKDYGDKVSQEDRLAIDRALNDLRDALKTEDAAKMKAATDAALQASQKLGEAMYKNTQANAQAGAQQAAGAQPGANAQAGTANGGKDDVVEAEVVDK